jgi:hypothetical protein
MQEALQREGRPLLAEQTLRQRRPAVGVAAAAGAASPPRFAVQGGGATMRRGSAGDSSECCAADAGLSSWFAGTTILSSKSDNGCMDKPKNSGTLGAAVDWTGGRLEANEAAVKRRYFEGTVWWQGHRPTGSLAQPGAQQEAAEAGVGGRDCCGELGTAMLCLV